MINNIYFLSLLLKSLIFFNLSMLLMTLKKTFIIEWLIIPMPPLNFNFLIMIDWMSIMFMSIVMFISSMVMLYSKEYMLMELKKKYFIMILMMFVISMILMIISPNMLSIILGWDGLGLISYCLIIYYQSNSSFNSGMLTLMTNRIGDVTLLMMIYLSMNLKSWNISLYSFSTFIYLMMLLIMIMTKSAQIPFSMWLPAAMAAPTPVSSLVHSSTLVTAGIYLLIRFNKMFTSQTILVMVIGLLTMLLASTNAIFEFDLKKIIAFSTLSQLGLMLHMLAHQIPNYVFFHLISHAMFKSLLFLCSGVVIHFMFNFQDIRSMGNIIFESPMIIMFFNFANMSLCGFPFLSGFYSKDLIYEMSLNHLMNPMIMILMYLAITLTLIYSFRLMYFLTFNYSSSSSMMLMKDNFYMNFSILNLFVMTIIFGNMMNWLLFSSLNFSLLNLKMKFFIYTCMIMSLLFFLPTINLLPQINLNLYLLITMYSNFLYLNKITFFNNFIMIKSINMIFYFNETMWNEFYMKSLINFILKKWNYLMMKFFSSYFIMIFMTYNLMMIYLLW